MSDKQKGLQNAIHDLLPNSEHRHCLRHLYNNFRLKHKGLALKRLMFEVGKTARECDFENAMEKIKIIDEPAYQWLKVRDPCHWSRAFFKTHSKCDHLLNNLSESFNGVEQIIEARSLPILSMLEKIREYLMERVHKQRSAIMKCTGNICPSVTEKLNIIKLESASYIPKWDGGWKFEVSDGFRSSRVVDLQARTCTCRMWDLTGIPCCHAISSCSYLRIAPEEFVDECFTRSTFMKTYSNLMSPIFDKDMWPKTDCNELLPPEVEKNSGRPQVVRRKEPAEIQKDLEQGKLKRIGTRNKCKNCGGIGHNKRGCKRGRGMTAPAANEEFAGNSSNQYMDVQTQFSPAPVEQQVHENLIGGPTTLQTEGSDRGFNVAVNALFTPSGNQSDMSNPPYGLIPPPYRQSTRSQEPMAISDTAVHPTSFSWNGQQCTSIGNITAAAGKRAKEISQKRLFDIRPGR